MVAAFLAAAVSVVAGCGQPLAHIKLSPERMVFPLPPAPARVALVTTIDDAAVFQTERRGLSRFLFGSDEGSPRPITKPYGLAAGDETLLVCDTQQNIVHVLDYKRRRATLLGERGAGRLLKPVAVALDSSGNRYVADTKRGEVVVFSPDNEPLRTLGEGGPDEFKPVALAIHANRLYVANGKKHRVEILNPQDGTMLGTFGEKGDKPGQFLYPSGLAVDADGNVYVADQLNCRVQVFSRDGTLIRAFGQPGDRAGRFARPRHLAVGPDSVTYVVDAGLQRIQMFDTQGRVLMLFGGPGKTPGSLVLPAGVCVDRTLLPHFADMVPPGFRADYLIFVSDQFSPRKVSVYAFGRME